jgi:hypothetical protein
MVITRLERWLEQEGVFEAGVGYVELAGELDWEPGGGTLYLRRVDDGKVWRVDVPVAVRPATPEEAKTALQREQALAALAAQDGVMVAAERLAGRDARSAARRGRSL